MKPGHRRRRPWWLISASAAGLALILAAVAIGFRGGDGGTRTAFASAPSGDYAVVAFPGETADTITAIGAGTGVAYELARVPHLEGYTVAAAVSPDGRKVAIVTPDGGDVANPVAALMALDVETGSLTRLVDGIDQLQLPVWSRDGSAVFVTRTEPREDGLPAVVFIRATADGSSATIGSIRASGAYPVGQASDGRLYAVAVDEGGSTLYADFSSHSVLADGITRDWKLSPDGERLAYIEADTSSGLRYLPRVIDLGAEIKGNVSAQSAGVEGQALGVSWQPNSATPLFGTEPGVAEAGSASAQSLVQEGFDVPLGFTTDGRWLASQHWTGQTFAEPGTPELQLISQGGLRSIPGATRFYGWARR